MESRLFVRSNRLSSSGYCAANVIEYTSNESVMFSPLSLPLTTLDYTGSQGFAYCNRHFTRTSLCPSVCVCVKNIFFSQPFLLPYRTMREFSNFHCVSADERHCLGPTSTTLCCVGERFLPLFSLLLLPHVAWHRFGSPFPFLLWPTHHLAQDKPAPFSFA